MNCSELARIARAMVAKGKGILAADESSGTLTRRFDRIKLESTQESRRTYREMLLTAPGVPETISGVIFYDETIRQKTRDGVPFPEHLTKLGVIPGIKVDTGARPLAGFPRETITEGLDGLRERLIEYHELGARFAKWRAVVDVTAEIPTRFALDANAHALARYAALCQENAVVPIIEPEVLMDGAHSIERCEQITAEVLQRVFDQLNRHRIYLEGMVLKPNMVISGKLASNRASPEAVAEATVRVLVRHVPAAVPGIAFLSGGQSSEEATLHLSLINTLGPLPWPITFSYGRALQDDALKVWGGVTANFRAGQEAFAKRAWLNSLAATGRYRPAMEEDAA
jgi:fructose-bisphosphate aldolase, class I